jgi:hypothetical protein
MIGKFNIEKNKEIAKSCAIDNKEASKKEQY